MKMPSAHAAFDEQSAKWSSDPNVLQDRTQRFQRFKRAFHADPSLYDACRVHFDAIAELEPVLTETAAERLSDAEKESYSELLFFHPLFASFNFVPMFLSFWSLLRVYLLPALSFLVPILTLLAPYLVMVYLFKTPVSLSGYLKILQSMGAGEMPEGPDLNPTFTLGKQTVTVGVAILQGLIQPYWTYQHLHSVDELVRRHGDRVKAFQTHYEALSTELSARGITFFTCPVPTYNTSVHMAAANGIFHTPYLARALKQVGRLEAIMTLAHHPDTHPVKWVRSPTHPVFRLTDTYDYFVPSANRKRVSVRLDRAHGTHALLTGPNKGGKSTVLRAMAMSAELAHTYGCSIGQLTATPFSSMHVCLKPDDLPGSKSRFEREIEFTASTLRTAQRADAPILILIDELYHSTNPPDALRSCEVYSKQLWAEILSPKAASVISTHLFDWVKDAPKTIQRICCPANRLPNGDVEFHYTLCPGVCTVSSVDRLLHKNGMHIIQCA